jgi:hypothetical protein
MTLPIEPPLVGEIRYFDRVEPALTAGQYAFDIKQELPSEMNLNKSNFNRKIDFNIRGPRWKINPANVHMRSPPKNEQGVLCDMSFPRIVLQRKTTPWERSLEGSNNDEDPWMALLLIRDDEMDDYCSLELSEGSPTGGGVKISTFTSSLEGDDPNRYVDALVIKSEFFNRIAPTPEELPLLVHALQVNPLDKEMCGDDEDGWFSVVTSNRIPAKQDCKYHACLISLEHVNSITGTLPGSVQFVPTIPAPLETNRPVSIVGSVGVAGNLDEDIIARREVLETITDGPITFPPIDGDPDPRDLGPAGIPPEIDKEIENDMGSQPLAEVSEEGGRKGNLFNALDILLANPLTGRWGRRKSEVDLEESSVKEMVTSVNESPTNFTSPVGINDHGTSIQYHDIADPSNQYLNPPTVTSGPNLTFPLLHHWTFKTGDGGDFEARMTGLRVRTHVEKEEAVGQLGSIASKSSGTYAPALLGNDMVPDVAINSYLTIDIAGDDGIRRTGYYRGPCIAVPTNHETRVQPYNNSDEARGLDLETGRDEISHSSAFELGRLLGMSDPRFIRSINRWRRLRYSDTQDFNEYIQIKDLFKIDVIKPLTMKGMLMKDILAEKVVKPQLEVIKHDEHRAPPAGIGGSGPVTDPLPGETFIPPTRKEFLREEYERYEMESLDSKIDRRGEDI